MNVLLFHEDDKASEEANIGGKGENEGKTGKYEAFGGD